MSLRRLSSLFLKLLCCIFIFHFVQIEGTFSLPKTEYDSLYDLYHSTNGQEWQWHTPSTIFGFPWNFTSPPENPCSSTSHWQGITCSSNCEERPCHVIELVLTEHGLSGSLPNTLGNLTFLSTFELGFNTLTGTIPSCLQYLHELISLELYRNLLTGTLPTWIGKLTFLKSLKLYNNHFHGTTPYSLSTLTTLRYLYLYENEFTGTIPNTLSKLKDLSYLELNQNQFTGTLPSTLGNLSKLNLLGLNENHFYGIIPTSLCNISSLMFLNVYSNHLSGSLSSCFMQWKHLEELAVNQNQLTGTIPFNLTQWKALKLLYLNDNQFTGSIPDSIGDLSVLEYLFLNQNEFTGTIPTSIGQLRQLKDLWLYSNHFTGIIPDSIGSLSLLENLYLNENYFSGTLTNALGDLTSIHYFYLNQNSFTGSIPSSLGNITAIGQVSLSQNEFSGTLSDALSAWRDCVILALQNNQLTGSIPSSFSQLEKLESISLSSNWFTGQGMESITSITLQNLYVFENLLSGTLPVQSSPLLDAIDISNNLFTGSLPDGLFASCLSLEMINLNDNMFTGSIPSSLFQSQSLLSLVLAVNCFSGTVPDSVCNSTSLTQLILDGLHSASVCTSKAIPDLSGSGLISNDDVSGSIPPCLWQLPHLSVLHLGANMFSGSISDVPLTSSLNELVLSSNQLTGAIPMSIWQSNLTIVDLSFNRLEGRLPSDMLPLAQSLLSSTSYSWDSNGKENVTVKLQVNQLAGTVPSWLQSLSAGHVNILEGNMFACDLVRNNLPKNDPQYETYECGSDSTNYALIVFGLALLTLLLFINGCRFAKRIIRELMNSFKDHYLDTSVDKFCQDVYQIMNVIVTICLLGSILFGCLSIFFSSYADVYVWIISAIYKSGFIPALSMLCWFVLTLTLVLQLIPRTSTVEMTNHRTLQEVSPNHDQIRSYEWITVIVYRWLVKLFVIIINVAVVTIVNGFYVSTIVNNHYPFQFQLVIAFFLSLFKISWNYALLKGSQFFSIIPDHIIVSLCLFNNLLAPLFAEMFVSSDCFLYIVSQASSLVFDYQVYLCQFEQEQNFLITVCSFPILIAEGRGSSVELEVNPSFHYSYQCSFSLISSYTYVFIFRYVLSGLIEPMIRLCIFQYATHYFSSSHSHNKTSLLSTLTSCGWSFMMKLLTPFWQGLIYLDSSLQDHHEFTRHLHFLKIHVESGIFRRGIIAILATDLSMLICFGILFPPLAIVIAFSVLNDVLSIRMAMGRYQAILNDMEEEKLREELVRLKDMMNADIIKAGVGIWNGLWHGIITAAWIWAFILFDTLASAVGAEQGFWISIVMAICPILLHYLTEAFSPWTLRSHSHNDDKVEENKEDVIKRDFTFNTIFSKMDMVDRSTLRNPLLDRGIEMHYKD
jgi:Leucine-rich repeat (LRR) protein